MLITEPILAPFLQIDHHHLCSITVVNRYSLFRAAVGFPTDQTISSPFKVGASTHLSLWDYYPSRYTFLVWTYSVVRQFLPC